MKLAELKRARVVAAEAARRAGAIMRQNFRAPKEIKLASQHDIKLELDERCQRRIESTLRKAFPDISILGEEGVAGDPQSPCRWVVDPIDGTVNFTYGIPHACVSIALQQRRRSPKPAPPARVQQTGKSALGGSAGFQPAVSRVSNPPDAGLRATACRLEVGDTAGWKPALRGPSSSSGSEGPAPADEEYETVVGVVYDPFCDELFSAIRGEPARLNGRRIRVSSRRRLDEAIVSVGFAKTRSSLEAMLPAFGRLIHRVRKIRIMGSAALSLVYVACGRMDAYVERGLRLWDIAAGGLILECAGGDFRHWPVPGQPHSFGILVSNGYLHRPLVKVVGPSK
jgi:fructose-1,6-bisphosphatase/inositol monophosphatase family enzyme